MTNLNPVYSLSISGRLILEMHSLNNEGGEGNQTMTRTVTLVDATGNIHKVNAISGDMFKHIQAEHFYRAAREKGLALCQGCAQFRAERIMFDPTFMQIVKQKKTVKGKKDKDRRTWMYNDEEVIDRLLETCALDDTEGILIAPQRGQGQEGENEGEEKQAAGRQQGRSLPRKSVAEFGWVVGLPEKVRTESYFHVRYAAERGEEEVEQPIFHRPASSGIYASVATFELARIGFNDISQTYPQAVNEDERLRRYRAFLESVLYTYVEPNGAMRGTQNPHIVAFEGAVSVSYGVLPAPTISPLADDYQKQIKEVAQTLAKNGEVKVDEFSDMAGFAKIMRDLIDNTRPYRLFAQNGG